METPSQQEAQEFVDRQDPSAVVTMDGREITKEELKPGEIIQVTQKAEVVKKDYPGKPGPKTKMTPETLARLEQAFMYAYTDAEACLYAGIDDATLYRYQQENPEYAIRKRRLKLTPNLQAKKVLVESIPTDLGQARWWAERKIRDEFQPSAKVEHSGNVVMTDNVNSEIESAEAAIASKYEDELDQVLGKKKVEALPEATEQKK